MKKFTDFLPFIVCMLARLAWAVLFPAQHMVPFIDTIYFLLHFPQFGYLEMHREFFTPYAVAVVTVNFTLVMVASELMRAHIDLYRRKDKTAPLYLWGLILLIGWCLVFGDFIP